MATLRTLVIPLSTVPIGLSVLGPTTIPAGVTTARIVCDRTVGALPLSGSPAALVKIQVQTSLDGGLTWNDEAYVTLNGGLGTGKHDQTLMGLQVGPINGDPASATRLARATIATDIAFTTSGTLTLMDG